MTKNNSQYLEAKNFLKKALVNYDNVRILVQSTGAVKAPEYSHAPERVYAYIMTKTQSRSVFQF